MRAHAQQISPATDPQWYPVPTILPQGAKVTFVSGDPFKPGEFTVEFAMPNAYTLPPHTNPAREHVTIKEGALRVGLGRETGPFGIAYMSVRDEPGSHPFPFGY